MPNMVLVRGDTPDGIRERVGARGPRTNEVLGKSDTPYGLYKTDRKIDLTKNEVLIARDTRFLFRSRKKVLHPPRSFAHCFPTGDVNHMWLVGVRRFPLDS